MKKNPKSIALPLLAVLAVSTSGLLLTTSAQTDSGIPISKAEELRQKYSPKTSSEWRTYENKKSGGDVSFNPKTSELWLNPVTKKLEPVLREDGSPDPKENSVKTLDGKQKIQKTEKWFNPVTKKLENVLVEAGPMLAGTTSIVQYPNSLDNGLPSKTAKNWSPIISDKDGSQWKTYKNQKTGQVVSFNPKTSELWYNPVLEKWEPIAREQSEQQTYVKSVARRLLYKGKPANASHWQCAAYGTVHSSPEECADPDRGGVWLP